MKKTIIPTSSCLCFMLLISPAVCEEQKDYFIPGAEETPEQRLERHQRLSNDLYIDKDVDGVVEEADSEENVHHGNFFGIPGRGKENRKKFFETLQTAFPDGRVVINDAIEEGDKVVRRFTFTGTHLGPLDAPWFSILPSGKKVTITGITIIRLEGGKIVEQWEEWNLFETLIQLGVLPQPPYTSNLVQDGG